MSITRVLFFALITAVGIAIAFTASNLLHWPAISTPQVPPHCEPFASDSKIIGRPMTAQQVETRELDEAKRLGILNALPFGSLNEQWVVFKGKATPEDSFFEYVDRESGGYAIVRGNCVLDTLRTWIS